MDDYLAYGFITNHSVKELLHRRAYATIKGIRKPLTDNVVIEEILGKHGILCLNDVVHEVYNVGQGFEAANKVLCTFKLSAPVGHYEKKILDIHDQVEERGGFIGDKMDEFLGKIL